MILLMIYKMLKSEFYSSRYVTRTEPAIFPPWDYRELRFSHRIAPKLDPNHLGIIPKHLSYIRARKPLIKQSQILPQSHIDHTLAPNAKP